ncbi:hypothetical protein [Actinophytocola sediminis]
MTDFDVEPSVLATVSTKLSLAASIVDGVPASPPPPQAGDCTAVVAMGLASLCNTTDSVAVGLQGARAEVDNTLREYQQRDQTEANAYAGRS